MEKIHLVTCKNIKSWSKSKKNILLGGWCYDYKKKNEYKKFNFEIVNYPTLMWCERKDINFANKNQKIIDEKLKLFARILNKFHNTNYSNNYWFVILSPWLSHFISTILILEERLKIISSKYKISSATFYKNKDNIFLPKDYAEGFKLLAFDGNYINKIIYEIFNQNFKIKKINFIECENKFNFKQKDFRDTEGFSIKKIIKKSFFKFADFIPLIENKPFISGTVLPTISETFLKIVNFQSPKYIDFSKSYNFRTNYSKRNKINLHLLFYKNISTENNFLTSLILKYLPCSYIENYKKNVQIKNNKNWPKSPKYIFSCLNHYFDEIFKIYAAENVEQQIPYFLGQHGNNYSTRIPYWKFPETYTASKFLVWGKKLNFSNSIGSVNLRKPKKILSKKFIKKNGILLLCKTSYNETNLLETIYDDQNENFEFLKRFIENLNEEKKNQLTIRLLNHEINKYCCEGLRFKDYDPKINLEFGNSPVFNLINKNNITVFGYDSTGFLECLSLNIPVLMYINIKELKYLRSDVINDYKTLIRLKIIHTNSREICNHINKIWNNPVEWWYEKKLQIQINKFKEKYSRTVKNPVMYINKILKN